MIESHNVFAHIWAGPGILCFSARLCRLEVVVYATSPEQSGRAVAFEFLQAQRLLRMMVLLWIIRGMFTSNILYNPGFSMGLGLVIGFCTVIGEAQTGTAGPRGTKRAQ